MGIVSVSHEPKATFAEAQAAAGQGYLDPASLAESLSSWFYTGAPRLTDLPDFFGPFFSAVAIAHLRHPERELRVLDFGGVIGRYRDYVDAMFSGTVKTRWTIVETALYVEHGKAAGYPDVSFEFSLDNVAGPVDLAIFSSVLHYVPDWKSPLLHPVVRAAEHVFITRTPVADAEIPFLQTVNYTDRVSLRAARILNRAELQETLEATHSLFTSWALEHHLGKMGIQQAPSMLWRRRKS